MRKPLAFAVAFLGTLVVALVPLARDRSPPMRPRRAASAFAILAAACLAALAAACTGESTAMKEHDAAHGLHNQGTGRACTGTPGDVQ